MINILKSTDTIFKHPVPLAVGDIKKITLILRPDAWQSAHPYIEKVDVVAPSVFKGFAFTCTSGGLSGSVEPTWLDEKNAEIADGTATGTAASNHVIWKATPWDYLLMPTEDITAGSSDFTISGSIPLASKTFGTNKASVIIGPIPAGLKSASLKASIAYSGELINRIIQFSVK